MLPVNGKDWNKNLKKLKRKPTNIFTVESLIFKKKMLNDAKRTKTFGHENIC